MCARSAADTAAATAANVAGEAAAEEAAAAAPGSGARDASEWCAVAACSVSLAARLAVCLTTHALTASVDVCRTLCELLALLACVLANKYGDKGTSSTNRLNNSTFGLSRGAVLASLASRVLFASFSLALFVAALQAAAARAGHAGAPHAPLVLLVAGSVFALLAALRRMLQCVLPRRSMYASHPILISATADLICSIFMTISAAAAVTGGNEVAWLVDPILTAAACLLLVIYDYSEIRNSGLVLLQASPLTVLPAKLYTTLREIQGVHALHELHAWQLTPTCNVATAHVVYESQLDYMKSQTMVTEVFVKYGFTYVTIQPEFTGTAANANVIDTAIDSSADDWCAWGAICSNGAPCGSMRCCLPSPQDTTMPIITKL